MDINLKKNISNFYLKEVVFEEFFFVAWATHKAMKTMYHTITSQPCSQKL